MTTDLPPLVPGSTAARAIYATPSRIGDGSPEYVIPMHRNALCSVLFDDDPESTVLPLVPGSVEAQTLYAVLSRATNIFEVPEPLRQQIRQYVLSRFNMTLTANSWAVVSGNRYSASPPSIDIPLDVILAGAVEVSA